MYMYIKQSRRHLPFYLSQCIIIKVKVDTSLLSVCIYHKATQRTKHQRLQNMLHRGLCEW